jgi:hypothetical protein
MSNPTKGSLIIIIKNKEIKDLIMMMKITIAIIGMIVTVALVSWVSYEMNTFRADLAEGVAWMGPFL